MKIRVLGKTEYLRRKEYYECSSSYNEIEVPDSLGPNPSDEDIINALKSKLHDLDYDLVNDKDYLDEVSFDIERIEEVGDEEDEYEDELDQLMKEST